MTINISDNTKVSDMTFGQLKSVLRSIVEEVVAQAVFELEQELPDPDEGKSFRPEFVEKLQLALDESGELYTMDDVTKKLDSHD